MRRLLLLSLGTVGVVVGAVIGWSASALWLPAGADAEPRTFSVSSGESIHAVADRLKAAGLLPERGLFGPRLFVVYGRLTGADRRIKSGEYDWVLEHATEPLPLVC